LELSLATQTGSFDNIKCTWTRGTWLTIGICRRGIMDSRSNAMSDDGKLLVGRRARIGLGWQRAELSNCFPYQACSANLDICSSSPCIIWSQMTVFRKRYGVAGVSIVHQMIKSFIGHNSTSPVTSSIECQLRSSNELFHRRYLACAWVPSEVRPLDPCTSPRVRTLPVDVPRIKVLALL
jgi:hypothetical protein